MTSSIESAHLTVPESLDASEHQLQRSLGPVNLILIGIGSIIGAGIFVITGTAAAEHAGPAVLISFVIAGLGCLFAGLCYAEFASMIPESGSAYTYAYATMGRSMAWFIGWNMVLEYLVSASTVAVGWSGYLMSFLQQLQLGIPSVLSTAPLAGDNIGALHLTGEWINLPAVGLIMVLSAFLIVGLKSSATFNGLMVLIKTVVVLLVIVFGMRYVRLSNLTPFVPPNQGSFGKFGLSGILAASGMIFFAYIGFEAVSVAAQEARNPRRDVPIGILGSLAICTVLYMLMALVLTGITNWRTLGVPNPVSFAVGKISSLGWLVRWIDVGALVGLASVTFISLYGQSRVFYSMARDGFLPPAFSAVHPRFRTPHRGTLVTGIVAVILAAIFPLDILADLVSIGTLCAFIAVCAGILILRIQAPRARRPFRTPFVWFVGVAGILSCSVMAFSLSWGTWLRLIIWTVVGFAIFLSYGIKHAAKQKWKVSNEA